MSIPTIEIQRGETASIRYTITDLNGSVPNLTGALASFVVRSAYAAGTVTDDSGALINKTESSGITLTTPASGILDVVISEADTKSWEFETPATTIEHPYGLKIKLSGYPGWLTVEEGTFIVTAETPRR